MALALEALTKAAVYAALLIAVGACVTHWLLCPRVGVGPSASVLGRQLARLELRAGVVLLVATIARVLAHTVSVFGGDDAFAWRSLVVIAFESRWGGAWRLQAIGAALLVGVARCTRDDRQGGWVLASVASVGVCYLLPLAGHAAGSTTRVLVHGSHVLGAGIWLGTLATVYLLRRCEGRMQGTGDVAAHAPLTASMLHHLAPIAFSGALMVTAAGLVVAWLYVGSISNLAATVYGRVLTLKIAAFGVVTGCGFFNWRRLHRGSDAVRLATRHAGVIALELVFAAVVIAVTGVMTELAHP